jgi:hypothetical protein
VGKLVGVVADLIAHRGEQLRDPRSVCRGFGDRPPRERADARVPSVDESGCRQVLQARRVGASVLWLSHDPKVAGLLRDVLSWGE